jgi:hypothetical protein
MPRQTTGPRYWASKNGYYVTVKGERVCLAKGPENDPDVKAEAERRYHEIKLVAQTQTEGDRSPCITVLDAFLVETRSHKKPSTYAMYRRLLQDFCKELGTVRVRDLKQHRVTAWLAKKEEPRTHRLWKRPVKWGPGTRRIAISALKAALTQKV